MSRSGMPSTRRYWFARLPLPAYFGLVTVLYGSLRWGVDAIGHPREATLRNFILQIVFGALFGAAMTAVLAFQRRRFGGPDRMIEVSQAIRTGTLPAGIDCSTWAPLVDRRITTLRRSRWLAPVLMAPLIVFAVVAWILEPDAAPPAIGLLALSGGLVALSEWQVARYLPRALSVRDQLESAPASKPAPDDRPLTTAVLRRPRATWAALGAIVIALAAVVWKIAAFLLAPGNVQSASRQVSAAEHLPLARAEQLVPIAVAVLLAYWVVLLVGSAVFGWFGFLGRNWGRGGLVPVALVSFIELISATASSVIVTVALIAAVVLLYTPPSTAYVKAQRDRRAAPRMRSTIE